MLERGQAAGRRAAGRGDRAAHRECVHVLCAQQRGGAGEVAGDEVARDLGRQPGAHRGVDLRLGDERDVGRGAAHDAHRDVDLAFVDGHDRSHATEQLLGLGGQRRVAGVVARVAADALAHLDRHARQHPHDRRPAVRGLQRGELHPAEDRDHATRLAADLRCDALQALRLVAQHDDVRAARELGVGLDDLAVELGDERLGTRREGVVDEHRVTPAARQRSRHVARTDEADPHEKGQYRGAATDPRYD